MVHHCLIIEDHPLFAEALQYVLDRAIPELQFEHQCSIEMALATIAARPEIQLIILDLCLPDVLGLGGLLELRLQWPRTPIVVVSAYDDQALVQSAIVCGAAAYIPKTASRDVVVSTIQDVFAGYSAAPVTRDQNRPVLRLTHQQLCVLQMISQGMPNKHIASRLGIFDTTVKAHVSQILHKLGVPTRTQAALRVINALSLSKWDCAQPVFTDDVMVLDAPNDSLNELVLE